MQIELTETDISQIESALECWERQPAAEGMTGMMIGAIFDKDKIGREAKIEAERQKIDAEIIRRKRVSVLLRAKLVAGLTRGRGFGF